MTETVQCPFCKGTGKETLGGKCAHCHGTGRLPVEQKKPE